MFYKAARVEYHPVGVVGAIVPWNYPFHNVFNPLTAAIFAGNAIVIKVARLLCCNTLPACCAHACLPDCCRHTARRMSVSNGVQVSEHASWSAAYYGRIISAALEAAGESLQCVVTLAQEGRLLAYPCSARPSV